MTNASAHLTITTCGFMFVSTDSLSRMYSSCMSGAVNRRLFLNTLAAAPALAGLPDTASRSPRKVIVGTVMHAFWVEHPGVTGRLRELSGIVDDMQKQSRQNHG